MIKYRKGWAGICLLVRIAGTSWPHGIGPGLLSAGLGLVIGLVRDIDVVVRDSDEFLVNPYPYQLFAYLVGFVLVFRTNFGYLRYWEALDAVQRMSAKWLDGACMAIAFDAKGDVSHPFLQSSLDSAPDLAGARKSEVIGVDHTEFFEEIIHLFSLMHALAFQYLRCDDDLGNICAVVLPKTQVEDTEPARSTSGASMISGIRAKDGYRKAWSLQLKVLGGLRSAERACLEADGAGSPLPALTRVSMVESWIMRRLVSRQKHETCGDMGKTSPPILSRMVQVISDGNLGFSQAAKVAETPFPFPYHNMISILLWMYALTTPFVVNANLLYPAARFVVNFVAVWSYFSLAEVGDNMEDPFMPYDCNDLPLEAGARLGSIRGERDKVFGKSSMTDLEILLGTWDVNKATMSWLLLSGILPFAYNITRFSIVHVLSPSATAFGGNFSKALHKSFNSRLRAFGVVPGKARETLPSAAAPSATAPPLPASPPAPLQPGALPGDGPPTSL